MGSHGVIQMMVISLSLSTPSNSCNVYIITSMTPQCGMAIPQYNMQSKSWLPFVDYCWLLYVSMFNHSWPPDLPLFRCGSNPCTPSCSHQKKCLWKFIPSKNLAKWRFPKSSGSSYQPFFFGIFILNQPALGVPLPTARLVFRLPRRRGARQGGWQEPCKLRWPRLMIY